MNLENLSNRRENKKNKGDGNIENWEHEIEKFKNIGEEYENLLNYFIYKDYEYKKTNSFFDDFIDDDNLNSIFENKGIDADKLLNQVGDKYYEKDVFNNEDIIIDNKYKIPVIFIKNNMLNKLFPSRGGAIAFAVRKVENPFIVIREKANKNNINHEISHILWENIRDKLPNQTDECFIKKENFDIFRDEIVAKISGKERPHGYTLFDLIRDNGDGVYEHYKNKYAEEFNYVEDMAIEIDEKLRLVNKDFWNEILGAVIESGDFNELNLNIDKILELQKKIESQKEIEKEEDTWNNDSFIIDL